MIVIYFSAPIERADSAIQSLSDWYVIQKISKGRTTRAYKGKKNDPEKLERMTAFVNAHISNPNKPLK